MLLSVSILAISDVNALETLKINKVTNAIGIDLDFNSKIDLYDEKDNVIANYFRGSEKGYLIVNSNTYEPLEYSYTSSKAFLENKEEKFYYSGLLNYYKELDSTMLINEKDETILRKDLTSLELNNDFEANNITRRETRVLTTISYVPRAYSYNPNGICGSTASAIFLMYYDDHVNDSYIPTTYESSGTGEKTVLYLKNYIDGATPGSTYSDMKSGLNRYLLTRGFSQTASILSTGEVLLPIGSNRPVIVGLTGHPTYGNHWVVGYGYNRYVEGTTTIYMIIVSNGWGQTGVYINRTYYDGGVRI